MKITFLIIAISIFAEIVFRPRVQRIITGDYLLWYGKGKRKYVRL